MKAKKQSRGEVLIVKKHTVDMTQGNIFKLIVIFAIPIMISGVLQTLYNATDMIVVGKFAGKESLAAVGSTAPAINMIINVFIGMSSATNVIVARKFGAGNKSGVSKAVHTAVALCLAGGIFIMTAGIFLSKNILVWMSCPGDVIDLSTIYMQIYCVGIPAMLIYNFGSAIMRAFGDATRPTYYLAISGLINVVLNLLFVIVFKMGVAGVAIGTVVSQVVAATLVIMNLRKFDEQTRLKIRNIRFHANELKEMLVLGIPAGIQSSIFSVSNVIIQSSINSCGSDAMAGNSAAGSIENLEYVAMGAFFHAVLTFMGQNIGAKKFDRIRKGYWMGFAAAGIFGVAISVIIVILSPLLVKIYTDSQEVARIGVERLVIIGGTQFLCGLMEIGTGSLRGIGVATRAMITCLIGVCGVRILMNIVGAPFNTPSDLKILYASYPASWTLTAIVLTVLFFSIINSRERKWNEKLALQENKI